VTDQSTGREKRRKIMPDKTIKCRDCGAKFTFTEKDQAFYKEKGYMNEPQRCSDCRAARKQKNNNGSGRTKREMFSTVCSECGTETAVPFRPNADKPVYCMDCYQRRNK
jgi:CxxC-x17-CxxC domain-containing protein